MAVTISCSSPKLNNNVDKHLGKDDPRIKLGMCQNLVEAGIAPLKNVKDLLKPNAAAKLLKRGFTQSGHNPDTYELGDAFINGNGQRAIFFEKGKVALSSFSAPSAPRAHPIIEIIKREKDGTILNTVQMLP